MFNFPFYKYYNPLTLNTDLHDYIKKSNIDSFNKFAERNKQSKQNKLQLSLINYRNYSDTFLRNHKKSKDELKNEDYLCDFCDLNENDNSDNNNTNTFFS